MPRPRGTTLIDASFLAAALAFTAYEELHLRRVLFHRGGTYALIAGSLPNFLAVLDLSLAAILLKRTRTPARTILSITAGLILYEIAQIWMPHRVFDWNDIAATLLGGLVTWLLTTIARRLATQSL